LTNCLSDQRQPVPVTEPAPAPRFSRRFLAAAALALATVAVFWPVRSHRFLSLDDGIYVVGNTEVAKGLSGEGIRWAFTSVSYASNWHPLTWLSHMLDVQLFGLDPGGHHLTSVLIHALTTALLFWVLFAMTAAFGRSLVVAICFGLHPLHVESVAWVAERKDILCGFFWMLSLLAYHAWVKRPHPGRYLAAVGAFALGLLSKPMIVTLPFALLLLDFWPLGRLRRSRPGLGAAAVPGGISFFRLLIEKAPFLALSAISAGVTVLAQTTSIRASEQYTVAIRLSNAALAYAAYLGKAFWPAGIMLLYPHPGSGIDGRHVAAAGLLLGAISVLAVRAGSSRPYLIVGWLWYLGTLVPVIGLIQVGRQAMANRYTYLPLIGIFLAAAWLIHDIIPPWPRRGRILTAATAAVCLVLALLAGKQLETMRDDDAVYRHMLAVDPGNPKILHDWGGVLLSQGRIGEGVNLLGSVFRLDPRRMSAVRMTMAAQLEREGRPAESLAHYRKILALDPAHAEAQQAAARLDMAGIRVPPGAIRSVRAEDLRLEDEALAWLQEGNSLALADHCEPAIAYFLQAVRLDPRLADAQNNLGSCYGRLGRYREAVQALEAAVAIDPGHPQARGSLERARRALGR
jgi:tetratricopeptide (TPR) repeat protein